MTIQQTPYLRNQRFFPTDVLTSLSITCDRMYIDVATKVNERTIGIFAKDNQIITGESWYLGGPTQKQQTLRKLFTFTGAAANITHGIDFSGLSQLTRMYGNYTDGTSWFGLLGASDTAIAGQITFYVTSTQIVFLTGAGAPTATSGNVIVEWLANV